MHQNIISKIELAWQEKINLARHSINQATLVQYAFSTF